MRSTLKKVICVAVSAVMVFAMSATAFAADSPTASGVVTAKTGKDNNGNDIHFDMGSYRSELADVVANIRKAGGLKAVMGNNYKEGLQLVDVRAVDIEELDQDSYPIILTFNVPGVTAGSTVSVMCYVGGEWKVLQCVAGDGTVSVTFEDPGQLELVSFAADKSAANNTTDNKTTTGTTGNKTATGTAASTGSANGAVSPKTGENSVVPMAVVAMMLMVGGSLCLRKREVR